MTKKINIECIEVECLEFDLLQMNTMRLTFIHNDNINTSSTTETFTGHAAVVWRGLFMSAIEDQLDEVLENLNMLTHPATHSASMIIESADGSRVFFTPEEEEKLSQIAVGANKYIHPTNYYMVDDNVLMTEHSISEIRDSVTRVRMTVEERLKLATVVAGANNYVHPDYHDVSEIDGLVGVDGFLIPQTRPIMRLDATNRLLSEPLIELTSNNSESNLFGMAIADLPSAIVNSGLEPPYLVFDKSVPIGVDNPLVRGVCLMFGPAPYYTMHWFSPLDQNLILDLISSDGVSEGYTVSDPNVLMSTYTKLSKLSFHSALNIQNFIGKILYFSTTSTAENMHMVLYKRRGFRDYTFSGTFKQTDVVNRFTAATLNSFLISRDPSDTVPYTNPIWISNLNAYQTQHWDYTVCDKVKAFHTLNVPNKALLFNYGYISGDPYQVGYVWRYSLPGSTVFSAVSSDYDYTKVSPRYAMTYGNMVIDTFISNYGTKMVVAFPIYTAYYNETTIVITTINWTSSAPTASLVNQYIDIPGRISDIALNCMDDRPAGSSGPIDDKMVLVFQTHTAPYTLRCYEREYDSTFSTTPVQTIATPTFKIDKLVGVSRSTKTNGIPDISIVADSIVYYATVANSDNTKYGVLNFNIISYAASESDRFRFDNQNYLNPDFSSHSVIPLQRAKYPDFLTVGQNHRLQNGALITTMGHCVVGYADGASIDIPNHALVLGYFDRYVFVHQQIPNYVRTGGNVQLSNMLYACVGDGQSSELWFIGSTRFIQRFQPANNEWRFNPDTGFGVWDYRITSGAEGYASLLSRSIPNPMGKLPRFLLCMENRGIGTASCMIFGGKVYSFVRNSTGTATQDWAQLFGRNQPFDLDGAHTTLELKYIVAPTNETWDTWAGRTFTYFGWFGNEYTVGTSNGSLVVSGIPGKTMFAVVSPGQTIYSTYTPNMILFRYQDSVDALHVSDFQSWATAVRLGDDDIVTNRPIQVTPDGMTFTGTGPIVVAIFFAEFEADIPGVNITASELQPVRAAIHTGSNKYGELDTVINKTTSTLVPHPAVLNQPDEKYLWLKQDGTFSYDVGQPEAMRPGPCGVIPSLPVAKFSFSDNKVTAYTKYPVGDYFETNWMSYTLPATITVPNKFFTTMVMVRLLIRNVSEGLSEPILNDVITQDGHVFNGLKIRITEQSIIISASVGQTYIFNNGSDQLVTGEVKLIVKRLF